MAYHQRSRSPDAFRSNRIWNRARGWLVGVEGCWYDHRLLFGVKSLDLLCLRKFTQTRAHYGMGCPSLAYHLRLGGGKVRYIDKVKLSNIWQLAFLNSAFSEIDKSGI